MDEIPIILLAAGNSKRMGLPKQLLPWGNQTLIEHQINELLKTGSPVNVVLGANHELIKPYAEKLKVNIIFNANWESGMGSSIASGIKRVNQLFPAAEGALITLVDQPLVTSNHLKKLLKAFHPGERQIIVSRSSAGWNGVPVLFDKTYFEELKRLNGDEGAKSVIKHHQEAVIPLNCNENLQDMDTTESYRRLHSFYIVKILEGD